MRLEVFSDCNKIWKYDCMAPFHQHLNKANGSQWIHSLTICNQSMYSLSKFKSKLTLFFPPVPLKSFPKYFNQIGNQKSHYPNSFIYISTCVSTCPSCYIFLLAWLVLCSRVYLQRSVLPFLPTARVNKASPFSLLPCLPPGNEKLK